MADIGKIIKAIDEFLERKHQKISTPVEINSYLEKIGLLNDSKSRPGKPLRAILKKGKIPHAYQVGVYWYVPHSKDTLRNQIRETPMYREKRTSIVESTNGNKLSPIGNLIIEIIEKKYKKRPSCLYEYKPDWLFSNPSLVLIENHPELSELYSLLTEQKISLKNRCAVLTDQKRRQRQSFDIWIGEPFNFAVEFDEKQHFNQFRKITFDFYDKIKIKYPLKIYKQLIDGIIIKPGLSGFTKLQSFDPLFPELLEGEKQDNRIRQRAFRDFLKDLLPIEYGFNPTVRIPYHIANNRISGFTEKELQSIENYLINNELI